MLNEILYANYLLNADVLKPEPTEHTKKLRKLLWKSIFPYEWYILYINSQRCYE